MACSFLSSKTSFQRGVTFSSDPVLKFGVSLLGFRLGLDVLENIGIHLIATILILIVLTILFGTFFSKIFIRNPHFGILSSGAVAICGASAAAAIYTILPEGRRKTQELSLVVISVTLLSTIAMIIYPILFQLFNFHTKETGFLIGATIHDVAQVIGAGYSVTEDAGIIATFVKMVRVSCLPVIILILLSITKKNREKSGPLPWFLVLFFIFALITNLFDFSVELLDTIHLISSLLIIIAISAVGVKTNLAQINKLGLRFFSIIVAESVFLLTIGIGSIYIFRILDY